MGYASHRIFHLVPASSRSLPLGLYFGQLALNFAWTPLFFGMQRFGAATVCIGGMWVGIAATAWQFAEHDTLAGALMAPYLAWVSYASTLTWYIWRNNKGFRNRKQVGDGKGKKKAH
ncbi:TspO/MBR-related protein [Catenaria anguillulae PL171]|uniref:TspO/MBR-related protein n=1 Tax=Catenaria anguillulae PL171 TaxID=765915 RepID=A0A1Y2H759_9FUNG|nr:TspO/MBR-related protein [Catenaria anguillulae PL171]